jgi:septal ring factor EnvC (AmiA/AmiB activator)
LRFSFNKELSTLFHVSFLMRVSARSLIFSLPVLLFAGPAQGQSTADETRGILEQWVETHRALSQERTRWEEERAFLNQSMAWMRTELAMLEQEIADAEETGSAAEERRAELTGENEAFQEQARLLSARFAELEREMISLVPTFPPALLSRVRPLLDRLHRGSEARLTQRAQNIVGLLNEVNRFNQRVTLAWEVRTTPEGRQAEVQTLYLGLAQAYFVNDAGTLAGHGRPSPDGWEWTFAPGLAGAVTRAVAVYSNDRSPEFLPLPVRLR